MLGPSGCLRKELLAAVCGLGAVWVSTALLVHLASVRAEQRQGEVQRAENLARLLAAASQSSAGASARGESGERLPDWAWSLIDDGDVIGIALVDPAGRVVDCRPGDIIGAEAVAAAVRKGSSAVETGPPLGRVRLAAAGLPDGWQVAVLCRASSARSLLSTRVLLNLSLLVAVTGLGVIWLRAVVDRSAVAPLETLIGLTEEALGKREMSGVGAEARPIGFAALATNVLRLIEDAKATQARIGQLKRTMDARVAEQTRQIESMLKRAEAEAWIDPLTRLGNRRLLEDRLEALLAEQRKAGDDLSVIVMDLDNFKVLNDTKGHSAGDELLAFVGELLRGSLRGSDIGLRLGGDEFAVFLLGSRIDEAAETAERLIKLIGQRASVYDLSPRVGASAGVASLCYHKPADGAELMTAADAGLYRAKRAGRSRVGIVPPPFVKLAVKAAS